MEVDLSGLQIEAPSHERWNLQIGFGAYDAVQTVVITGAPVCLRQPDHLRGDVEWAALAHNKQISCLLEAIIRMEWFKHGRRASPMSADYWNFHEVTPLRPKYPLNRRARDPREWEFFEPWIEKQPNVYQRSRDWESAGTELRFWSATAPRLKVGYVVSAWHHADSYHDTAVIKTNVFFREETDWPVCWYEAVRLNQRASPRP